jgi:UDP-3-O-[3-hydroxymyristoyl] glucosamine N-acyltransferase
MKQSSFPKQVDSVTSVSSLSKRLTDSHVLVGMSDQTIQSVGSPDECNQGSLVFLRPQAIEELQKKVDACKAGVLIVNHAVNTSEGKTLLVTADPLSVFIKALAILFHPEPKPTVHESAVVSPAARLAAGVSIGANSVVEAGVTLEPDCRIGANCFIGGNAQIGQGTVIQNNVSVGGVGLGFHFESNGQRLFFPHLGAVLIGANAVIGSGCVIARGQLSDTVIGAGSRLGNLVNVGHNVRIGENCAISSGSSIAGGVHIGDECQVGVGACFNAKINVSSHCKIGMGTVVTKSLPQGVSVFGNPAKPLPTMDKF